MNVHNANHNLPLPETSEPDEAGRQLDDQFADLTDALLAGREIRASDNLRDLASTARQLNRLFNENSQPSAAFRTRLARRLDSEWSQQRQERFNWQARLRSRRVQQWGALAAALLVLIGAAAVFGTEFQTNTAGLAGGTVTAAFVIMAGLFVLALIGFGLRRGK